MIHNGTVVKSNSGRRIRVDGFIKAGGQGEVYRATEMNSSQKGVVKIFHPCFTGADTVRRVRFLLEQNLSAACRVLYAPTDIIDSGGVIGHFTPWAPGQSLEELLANPTTTFMESMQLAITLAVAIKVMHTRQIAHGDLHAENLVIDHVGSVCTLAVIDLDNFNAPGVPIPPMVGQNLYLCPELRDALATKRPAIPDLYTDRLSMGVLMHEIILLRHVAAGADANEADFSEGYVCWALAARSRRRRQAYGRCGRVSDRNPQR